MTWLFYSSGAIAAIMALAVVFSTNAMRALISLIVSFVAIAIVLWTLGAPFAAALQVFVYAGAIVVLFIFVVMILNVDRFMIERERGWLSGLIWVVPVLMSLLLLAQFIIVMTARSDHRHGSFVFPNEVGKSLYTTYLIGVELASILLLVGLVAAFHFGSFMAKRGSENG